MEDIDQFPAQSSHRHTKKESASPLQNREQNLFQFGIRVAVFVKRCQRANKLYLICEPYKSEVAPSILFLPECGGLSPLAK